MALICHCLAVPESAIVAAIDPDCADICDLTARCGAGAECGGCHLALDDLLIRYRRSPNGDGAVMTA